MRQTPELTAETQVMRAFDAALVRARDLGHRSRRRVVAYIHERLTDELAELASANGQAQPAAKEVHNA